METRTILRTIGLIAALLLLAGLLTSAPAQHAAAQSEEVVEVTITETNNDNAPYAFEPEEIRIEPGTTVRWVLDHDVFHTVTSTDSPERKRPNELFDQSVSSEGDTFEFTFDEEGIFHYYCSPHAGFMEGSVAVVGEGESIPTLAAGILLVVLLGIVAVTRRR